MQLQDKERQRAVPVELYFPSHATSCTASKRCPVAILGAGYGVSHLHYSFIAAALNGAIGVRGRSGSVPTSVIVKLVVAFNDMVMRPGGGRRC
jgi:predicted dienelactone hydrolase